MPSESHTRDGENPTSSMKTEESAKDACWSKLWFRPPLHRPFNWGLSTQLCHHLQCLQGSQVDPWMPHDFHKGLSLEISTTNLDYFKRMVDAQQSLSKSLSIGGSPPASTLLKGLQMQGLHLVHAMVSTHYRNMGTKPTSYFYCLNQVAPVLAHEAYFLEIGNEDKGCSMHLCFQQRSLSHAIVDMPK